MTRETMDVDVVIVGAGPAGLAAAIRLRQLAQAAKSDVSVVIVEKAAAIGGHIISGAVFDTSALDNLIPNALDRGAPLGVPVSGEKWNLLSSSRSISIPLPLLPPMLQNHGGRIVSLGEICEWLAREAEALGVDIFPGIAATELLRDDNGVVVGIATGDLGRGQAGQPKPGFAPGMELRARYTLLAEGARGSLSKQAIAWFELDKGHAPQKYGLGFKEVWEVSPELHRTGLVEHFLGWPLPDNTGGGGFIYHADKGRVNVGYVVHLNYKNPKLSPFDTFQRFKTHPSVARLLRGATRISYGARALTEGGWQSIPELAFPGGALIGCAAGFMNVPRIKGSHNAMWSGIRTAEEVFVALGGEENAPLIQNLRERVLAGPIQSDLFPARNAKPLLTRFGTMVGMTLTGLDLWVQTLFGRSLFGTLTAGGPDHASLERADQSAEPAPLRPDNVLTFDRLSSVHIANIDHDEDQPIHLRLRDPAIPVSVNLPLYDEPSQRYCPAGVYEIITGNDGPAFHINAANCIHCKTCDIKDPSQNIDWVPPEGGSGPNYSSM